MKTNIDPVPAVGYFIVLVANIVAIGLTYEPGSRWTAYVLIFDVMAALGLVRAFVRSTTKNVGASDAGTAGGRK